MRARSRVKHAHVRMTETTGSVRQVQAGAGGLSKADMEKQAQSQNKIFSRLNPPKYEHLKPLSLYSRMISCDQNASLHQPSEFSNPFINFKIEVVNTGTNRRKLYYSSSDDGCETLAKFPFRFCPKDLSPDLGCFMDYCSPSASHDSVSPVANTNPAYLGKAQRVRSKIKATPRFRQHLEHVGSGLSTDPRGEQVTVPRSLKNERVLVNVAFDHDVNNIFCLNPCGTYTAGRFLDYVGSCKNPNCNTCPNKPVLVPTVAHGKEVETGVGQAEEGRGELDKDMCLGVKDEEEDKGYFSMSYINERKAGKTPPQSVDRQLPTANSTPLLGTVKAELPEDECHSEGSDPLGHKQASMFGQCFSFTEDDLCATVRGRLMEPVKFPMESLESDVTEVWQIGPPVFESSICQSVTVDAAGEQSRQVSEKVQVGMKETIHKCQATLSGEGTTLDTSCETTLPLQVQVKSKVVLSSQHTNKPEARLPAVSNPEAKKPNQDTAAQTPKCKRPVVFNRKVDWEVEKRRYVLSVTSHMKEKSGAAKGALSELSNLMTNVADDNTNGKQWQHPSDLTCRNYQKRRGNIIPKMTLDDWLAKNGRTHRRFEKVPKIFERSYLL